MGSTFEDYRSVLKFEFQLRNKKNNAYSMRAFARDIELSPSRLSEIFAGKQGLSPERAKVISTRLGFSVEKVDWFCNLVTAESSRNRHLKSIASERVSPFKNGVLSVTTNDVMDFDPQWYHFVIRRMTQLSNFKSDPLWIADQLTLSPELVTEAIDEMLKLGMLYVDASGNLSISENYTQQISPNAQKTIRRSFRMMLYKAYRSARDVPKHLRSHGMHYLSIHPDQIEDAKALIKEFEDKIDHLTYKSSDKTTLYSLIISFFPLIKPPSEETPPPKA